MARTAIRDFALSNKIYVNATVTFYTVEDGARTTTKATLYSALTGTTTLANPQTLDSYGKLRQPVYVDQAVIGVVTGLGNTPDHDTGVITEGDAVNDAAGYAEDAQASAEAAEEQRLATVEIPSNSLITATGGSVEISLADRFRNLYDPVDYGADPTGVADSTAAFQYCLDTFRVCMPRPGIYMVGDLAMVAGGAIVGMSGPTYSTNTSNGNTILRRKNGASCIVDMSGKSGYNIQNIVFDGVNRNCHGVVGMTNDFFGGYIANCTFRYCDIGLGGINNGATYGPRGAKIVNCTMTENNTGIQSPIDTHFTDCVIAGNISNGVNHTAGSNDNMFCNCKIEWNRGAGVLIFSGNHNTYVGGIYDRNYNHAITIRGTSSHTTVSGVMFRRNGRTGSFGNDCHIEFDGSTTNTLITGCTTRTGADDDGGGPTTPTRCVTFTSGSPTFAIVGNDMSGCNNSITGSPIGPTYPSSTYYRVECNVGAFDAARGISTLRNSAGIAIDRETITNLLTGSSTSVILNEMAAMGTFNMRSRKVRINGRRNSSSSRYVAEIMLLMGRESGNASLRKSTIMFQDGDNATHFSTTSNSLDYDGQTGNFTVGQVVTGATSGATGTISADSDAGTTGTLTLTGVTGTFQDNETITDPLGGSAVANNRDYYASGTLVWFSINSDATEITMNVHNRMGATGHYSVTFEQ